MTAALRIVPDGPSPDDEQDAAMLDEMKAQVWRAYVCGRRDGSRGAWWRGFVVCLAFVVIGLVVGLLMTWGGAL